jgi:hypothetical protein
MGISLRPMLIWRKSITRDFGFHGLVLVDTDQCEPNLDDSSKPEKKQSFTFGGY